MKFDPELYEQRGNLWYRKGVGRSTGYYLRECVECHEMALIQNDGKYCTRYCSAQGNKKIEGSKASGEAHGLWKGDNASYKAFHQRLYLHKGKAVMCVFGCTGAKRYEWANLTGNYSKMDDYAQMCKTCHERYDAAVRYMLVDTLPKNARFGKMKRKS